MAGISQKIFAEEVLPLLARNVAVEGYQGRKDKTGRATEFLILLKRYVGQARELVTLAGPRASFGFLIATRRAHCWRSWATG